VATFIGCRLSYTIIVKTALSVLLIFIWSQGLTQGFPVTGQLASSAFPVCGKDTFRQATVPLGITHNLEVPGCTMDGAAYQDRNPFWYSFTCYESGSLGFLITPNNLDDDYDWMLYDITGRNVNEVYTNSSLIVSGNWAGTYGLTGARAGGSAKIQCASFPADNHPTFSNMPTLKKGHKYLLMVSHFTNTQSGYSLTFGGGSAIITDTVQPHLKSADIACDRKTITVVLNKQMRCNSLAADGSDFFIDSNPVAVLSASGANCGRQFDMDSFSITLNAPLDPGTYFLKSKIGTDENTLLDDCGTLLSENESVSFTVVPPHATPMDSLTSPTCAPIVLQLVFSDPIQCSSIAPDGSDFAISGSSAIGITKAAGNCIGDGLTNMINVTLSSPIVNAGNYQITLKSGTDGNTIINECGLGTPGGATISFSIKDTVSAFFDYSIAYGCKFDTIGLKYQPANDVTQWQWIVDSVFAGSDQNPSIAEGTFGPKQVQHIVSNGFCSDTVTRVVNLDNILQAAFQAPREVCPKDKVGISNISIGNIVSWNWDFGDGVSSTAETPDDHLYPNTATGKTYEVTLSVKNNLGCLDTAKAFITKLQSCYITVPNAFTPNNDGRNDYLYPLNAFSTTELEFMVYNRYGQLVFESHDWSRKWDGTISGKQQPTGTFLWTLRYTDASGKKFFLKGTSVLIR